MLPCISFSQWFISTCAHSDCHYFLWSKSSRYLGSGTMLNCRIFGLLLDHQASGQITTMYNQHQTNQKWNGTGHLAIESRISAVTLLDYERVCLLCTCRLTQRSPCNLLQQQKALLLKKPTDFLWSRRVNSRKRICKELWWKCLESMPEDETGTFDQVWGHAKLMR